MRGKVHVSSGYKHNGTICHDVTIKGKKFRNVPNLSKCEECYDSNCKYYWDCIECNDGVVRMFDCKKNVLWINRLWNLLTGALVVFLTISYYKTWNLGFFKGTAALIFTIVFLDIFSCCIEKLAERVRNNYFYRKLLKNQAKEKIEDEKKRVEKEAQKMKQEEKNDLKEPYRAKIREAEIILNQISAISKSLNLSECDKKIQFCVSKSREFIEYLKKDSSFYIRIESLLQVYLPEFYRILALYAEFKKANAVEKTQNEAFNDTVDYFYNFLSKQKIDAVFDKRTNEMKLYVAADTLRREIEKRGGKL